MIDKLRRHGILIGAAGRYGNILKIRPPLPFTRENADQVLDACDAALAEIEGESPGRPARAQRKCASAEPAARKSQ
jgi:acetylornithine/succinyldiaminopimelate/putrescine aminotransferase